MYESILITHSEDLIFMRYFFGKLNILTKLSIVHSLKRYPIKMLLIMEATLNLPTIFDIKCAIITIMFTNFKQTRTLHTVINKILTPFCITFDVAYQYLIKFRAHENIMKRLINYFVSTNMDYTTNIMCISKCLTIFILSNSFHKSGFIILTYDHKSNIINTYPLIISSYYYDWYIGTMHKNYFWKNVNKCNVIFYSDDGEYALLDDDIKLLKIKIGESFASEYLNFTDEMLIY